jgi:hypothetical protein
MKWNRTAALCVITALACLSFASCVTQPEESPGEGAGLAQTTGGPMLWPTESIEEYGFSNETYRFRSGFVTSAGARIPDQYLSYAYCKDSSGNPTRVAAAVPDRIDVLSLTGEVLLELAHDGAATELFCFADRVLQVVEKTDANSDQTAYLYDLGQGERIPVPETLQGGSDVSAVEATRLFATALVSGSELVPAKQGGRYGYRDLSGRWVKKPSYDSATEFNGGKALVSVDEVWSVIDTQFKPQPETYLSAEALVWDDVTAWLLSEDGYLKAFFSADFEQVTVWEEIAEFQQWGEWIVISTESSLFNIATMQWLDLPSEFQPRPGEFAVSPDGRQVFSYLTRETFELPPGLSILPVEQSLLNRNLLECTDEQGYPVYLSVKGQPLPDIVATSWEGPQAFGGIYYWATVGMHRGLLNADGQWIYQESRFVTLED